MKIVFVKEYSFRYGDLDKNGNVKIGAILDVLQDVAGCHSTSVGYSREKLLSESVAWLLQGWRVKTVKPLLYEQPVKVITGIMNVKKFTLERRYEMWQDGELKVSATADWFTVDINKMRPILVPDEILEGYDTINEEDNGLPFTKLRFNDTLDFVRKFEVSERDLDQNQHVNNAKSAEIVTDGVFEYPSELHITYRKAIMPSDIVSVYRKKTEDGWLGQIKNEENEICVLMSLISL